MIDWTDPDFWVGLSLGIAFGLSIGLPSLVRTLRRRDAPPG
jgi:hypothetical protein